MGSAISVFSVFLGLGLIVIVFILCRELVCWYFRLILIEDKLTKIVALLGGEEKAIDLLKKK